MSQQRRRPKARRPKRRRVGVFLVTTAAATVTVTAIAFLVITEQPRYGSDPLGAAVAQISAGKSGLALASARQKVILQTAATEAFTVTSKPKVSSPSTPVSSGSGSSGSGSSGGTPVVTAPAPDPAAAQSIAQGMLGSFGFASSQWSCLLDLWNQESGWIYNAENASGAYGIPQALPGSKMASAGADWATDPTTQIRWGLGYIKSTYGTPCNAWSHEEADGWY